jgi:hypothetical protein
MTRISLPMLRHLKALRTHALGYLSNLRDLELRARTAPVPQEDNQFSWHTLHSAYLENLLQVVFQYFRTLNSLEALQESTRRHLIELDQATNLLVQLNEQYPSTEEDESDQEDEEATNDLTPTVDVKAVERLAATQLVEFCYANPEIYLDPAGYYRFVPNLSQNYWSPVFESTPQEFYDLVNATFHQHPRRFRANIAAVWSDW